MAPPTDARPSAVKIEPYSRERHGNGPARVIENVYREFGFTWQPGGYHHDVLHPEEAYAPPDHFFDVAVIDGEVVGTVGGEARPHLRPHRRPDQAHH